MESYSLIPRHVPIWVGLVSIGLGSLFIIAGWWELAEQHHCLTAYLPVPARVVESHVKVRGNKSTTYAPEIRYTYSVNGRAYQSDTGLPISLSAPGSGSASQSWADELCQRYPVGANTTAWYSPTDPTQAFLIRKAQWSVSALAIFPVALVPLGMALMVASVRGRRKSRPPMQEGSYFRLRETGTLRGKLRLYTVISLACIGYGAVVATEHLELRDRGSDQGFWIVMSIYAALCLIPLLLAVRYGRLCHDFLDAEVCIRSATVRRGDTVEVRLRQQLRQYLEISEFAVGIVCMRSDHTGSGRSESYTTREEWSAWKTITVPTHQSNKPMEGSVEIAIPADAAPSGGSEGEKYPYFDWDIALRIKAKGQPTLTANFPVIVTES